MSPRRAFACFVLLFLGCARSHSPTDDDTTSGDSDSPDDEGDVDGDGTDDGEGCRPSGIGECPPGEPREGAECLVVLPGECFYLSEGCQRYCECTECRWEVTRSLGCG